MKFRNYFTLLILALALPASQLAAQDGDIYFSFSADGATPSNPTGSFEAGDSGSVYAYYSGTSNIDTGFGFALASSNNGIVNFTGVEIFNGTARFGLPRWASTNLGDIAADAQTIINIGTVNLPPLTQNVGIGVDAATASLDSGYDQATDSFLLGRFDFDVVGSGTTDFSFSDTQAVNQGALLDVAFGSATISTAIPEPGSALLLVAGFGLGLARRRRS